jgi:hypothetical protein
MLLAIDPPVLIVAPTRAAADEFALSLASEKGATFGVTRSSVAELVVKLALPALARTGLTPSAPLSDEAVSARVADALLKNGALKYFEPVAHMPGFPRALSRTLGEIRMSAVTPERFSGHDANEDLSALLARAIEERRKAGAVDYAAMLATASEQLRVNAHAVADKTVLLLDVPINSKVEAAFVNTLIATLVRWSSPQPPATREH